MSKTRTNCPSCASENTAPRKSVLSIVLIVCGGFSAINLAVEISTSGLIVIESLIGTAILFGIGIALWPFGKYKCNQCGHKFKRKSTGDA